MVGSNSLLTAHRLHARCSPGDASCQQRGHQRLYLRRSSREESAREESAAAGKRLTTSRSSSFSSSQPFSLPPSQRGHLFWLFTLDTPR